MYTFGHLNASGVFSRVNKTVRVNMYTASVYDEPQTIKP